MQEPTNHTKSNPLPHRNIILQDIGHTQILVLVTLQFFKPASVLYEPAKKIKTHILLPLGSTRVMFAKTNTVHNVHQATKTLNLSPHAHTNQEIKFFIIIIIHGIS